MFEPREQKGQILSGLGACLGPDPEISMVKHDHENKLAAELM